MSPGQLDTLCRRIPDANDRGEFKRLIEDGDGHHAKATLCWQKAWDIYHLHVPKKDDKKLRGVQA